MDQSVILWLFGTLIGLQTLVIGGLVSAIWSHAHDCRDFRSSVSASQATMSAKMDRVIQDIGDHETGLRGQVHKLASDITPYVIRSQK